MFDVGALIENRYRVLAVLGAGGMGAVYRVADEARAGEVVALKTLTLDASQPGVVAGFQREFRVLTQLRHPNLVTVYDYGTTAGGTLYFTMEYVPGQDLRAYLSNNPNADLLPLIVQVCRALAYLHARGLLHGDLKPSNILVVGDQVKLVDFGLAAECGVRHRDFTGTLGYAAPEVLKLQPIDHRADLYSLGATWYALLAGEPPRHLLGTARMAALTLQEILGRREDRSHLALIPLITRLLADSPGERYPSANALIEALNALMGHDYVLETRETAASYALRGRFVGRESEMAVLQSAWVRAGGGDGQVVLICGDSGTGKTRLVDEFVIWAELEGAWVVRGQCVELGSSAYQPWREILRVLVRYVEHADPAAIEHLGPFLAALLPELWQRPYLAAARPPPELEPQAEQLRLDESIAHLLRAASSVRRTALVIEDIHWSDEATLGLLGFLARIPAIEGLLLCATLREGEMAPGHALSGPELNLLHVRVGNLEPGETTALVRSMLGLAELPPKLVERVQATTAGNAYFVQELVRSLAEDGVVLQRSTTGWEIDAVALARAALPGTIRQVLLQRLQRLEPLEQAALRWAAVVGLLFWERAAAHLGGVAQGALRSVLDGLVDQQVLLVAEEPVLPGEREYRFLHVALRDVVYESLPEDERCLYHGRAADWLVAHSADRTDEHAAQVAEHYERARQSAQAGTWYERAARHARDTYALAAAVDYYRKALAFLPHLEMPGSERDVHRLALYDGLGHALHSRAEYAQAAEAYTAMAALAASTGDPVAQARAWTWLSYVCEKQGDYHAALEHAQRALELAQAAGAQVELAEALNRKGFALFRLGEMEPARLLGEQSLALSAALERPLGVVSSLTLLGGVHDLLGHYEQAAVYQRRALEVSQALGNRSETASNLNNLGENARLRGDYAAAVAFFREAVRIAHEIGNHAGEMVFLTGLGGALVGLRAYAEAEVALRRSIDMSEVAAERFSRAYALVYLAQALLGQGKLPDALCVAEEALALGQETALPDTTGEAWRVLGSLAAESSGYVVVAGSFYDAPACFAYSLRTFQEIGMEGEQARTQWAWARYEIQQGRPELGQALWEAARETLARLGMVDEITRMERDLRLPLDKATKTEYTSE